MELTYFQKSVAIILIIYFSFGVFLFLMQKKLVYYPSNQDFYDCAEFKDYEKMNHLGTRFYFLKQSDEVVVVYHGNAGSACDRDYYSHILEPTGKSVLIVEYSGYSNDNETPSKKKILQDVENVQGWLQNEKFNAINVIGESVGTGAASYHAGLTDLKSLILISPFTSIVDVAPLLYKIYPLQLLTSENFDNVKYLDTFSSKVLIIHGAEDDIINPKHSKNLFESLKTKEKQYKTIKGAGHNNLFNFKEVESEIVQFVN